MLPVLVTEHTLALSALPIALVLPRPVPPVTVIRSVVAGLTAKYTEGCAATATSGLCSAFATVTVRVAVVGLNCESPSLVAMILQSPARIAVTVVPTTEQMLLVVGSTAKLTAPEPEPPVADKVVVGWLVGL